MIQFLDDRADIVHLAVTTHVILHRKEVFFIDFRHIFVTKSDKNIETIV